MNFTKLVDCYFDNYREDQYKRVAPDEINALEEALEYYFFFCLIWSVGCTVDLNGRRSFNTHLRKLMVDNGA